MTKLIVSLPGLAGTLSIHAAAPADWLIDPSSFKAQVHQSAERDEVILDNGLVRRVIRLAPNAATVSFENVMTGESIIRGVRPEARVMLDGVRYDIGGLVGQPVQNFLMPGWIGKLEKNPDAFQFSGFKTGKSEARFPWKKRSEWMPKDSPWPPPGVSLTLEFRSPAGAGVTVEVHYGLSSNRMPPFPPALRSGLTAVSWAARQKQNPGNNPRRQEVNH